MDTEVILSRFVAGLKAETFSLAQAHRVTGIPMSTLQGIRDDAAMARCAERLKRIAAALPKLDPDYQPPLAAAFHAQPAFDASRAVRDQIPDVERGLDMFGVPLELLVQKLGISARTWTNWKAGRHEPTYSDWVRALEAAQTLIELAAVDAADARQRESTGVA